jgi:Ran GTPase-activating protein (RanGAP) involved in mRNA processing and transport
MLYTLEWMPREQSFYFILNKTLRSQNRQELLPWFLFLRLFMVALSKLPSTKHRIVYRGIKMDISQEFPEGKTFIWWAFSSCSSSIKVLEQFLGQNGHRTIFNIECDSAKDISQHSFYQSENEMLMYPARQFQVVSSLNTGNQLRIIHLKEIQPPFPLIHIPQTSSSGFGEVKEIEPSLSVMHISQTSSTNTTYQNKQLQQLIEQCKSRSEVNLKEKNLNDEDMKIVVKEAIINKQCKILDLRRNRITSVGASIIAEALNNNTTLERLNLSRNSLCDKGVHSLTKTLSLNNSKIQLLDLQSTGITDEGVGYLAEMLKTNTTLGYLALGWNEISDLGVQRLANVLTHHNTTLKALYINTNKLVSDSSVDALAKMLKQNRTLKCLKIEDCNLSEKGKEKLRQIAQSKKDFKLSV